MSSDSAAIDRTWYAVSPSGEGQSVTFGVGLPVQEPGGEWSVVVRLEPIEAGSRKIFGVDGWQAVALGMRFVAARVSDLSARGWNFFWTEGGEAASADDLGL